MFGNNEFLEQVLSYEVDEKGNRRIFPLISVYPSHLYNRDLDECDVYTGRIEGLFGFFSSGLDSPQDQDILVLAPQITNEIFLATPDMNGEICERIRDYLPRNSRPFNVSGGICGFYDVIPTSRYNGVEYNFKINNDSKSRILLNGNLSKLIKEALLRETIKFNPDSKRHSKDITVFFFK